MQDLLDLHDTPLKTSYPGAGVGVLCIVQLVPFHRSANVTRLAPLLKYHPTAMQNVLDLQVTLLRALLVASGGLGVLWVVQVEPFHRSANVASVPALLKYHPTAMQNVLDLQVTLLRALLVPSGGLGVL